METETAQPNTEETETAQPNTEETETETPPPPQENPQPKSTPTPTPKDQKDQGLLKEYFTCILNRQVLQLNLKKVNKVLSIDLGFDLRSITTRMKYVLSEALCYYMKAWPAWSNSEVKGATSADEFYVKFREYLCYKLNYIIENEKNFSKDPELWNKESVDAETQTVVPSKTNKPEAPYTLVISGQPSTLNNVVFFEMDNSIVVKQHFEKSWNPLRLPADFLNHPYVRVAVDLNGTKFSRSNLHEYKRYITECGDAASCPSKSFVSEIACPASAAVYSYDYVSAYFGCLLSIYRKHSKNYAGGNNLFEDVVAEFLRDIKECNIHGGTIGEPSSVTFNIGGKTYIRNKKMLVSTTNKNKNAKAINFCEIVTPRVRFALERLSATEDAAKSTTSFFELQPLEELADDAAAANFAAAVANCVTYQCTLCNQTFCGPDAHVNCLDHFRFLHKGEQAVLCFKCRRSFEIATLCATRWTHDCVITSFKPEEGAANEQVEAGGNQVGVALEEDKR